MEESNQPLQNRMRECAQGLVEFVITLPILIFFLIGVFELGWLMRDYLIIYNVSREAARFASRSDILDLSAADVGFNKVYTHTINTLSEELPYSRMVLIVSVISIDAREACNPKNLMACDCLAARTNPYSTTLVRQPEMLSYTNYITRFPYSSTEQSMLDFPKVVERMSEESRQFNCELQKRTGGVATLLPNNMVTAEIAYEHHQLFGFPVISNPYTDPLVIHVSTSMRMIQDHRE